MRRHDVLFILAVFILLLLAMCLWAAGGQTGIHRQAQALSKRFPTPWSTEPTPPEGQLIILSYPLAYAQEPPHSRPPTAERHVRLRPSRRGD